MILETIRQAIERDRRTRSELCRQASIDEGQMCRFVQGKTGLSTDAADRLCEVLGLELVGWSPIDSEIRPSDNQDVLLIIDPQDESRGRWIAHGCYLRRHFVAGTDPAYGKYATHWMPLPEAPKG